MDLTLVSCNIRFDNPADGDNSWSHRRLFLRDTLLKHSPHIIATQEGRIDQLKDLESLLVEYELIEEHRSWVGARMYPCIFVRKDLFEIGKSEDIWLSETPDVPESRSFDSMFPRLMTYVELQLKNSPTAFIVVNTHLDHIKQETRIGQAKVLSKQIQNIQSMSRKLLLLGDFNDSPDSPVRTQLPPLQDAWKIFHHQEETSHHGFKGDLQKGERIDWILVSEGLSVLSCEMDKSTQAGKYPSDHFPVVCQIRV
jgi:endonuclease/exonuclease/phosphatase family metal-dependent hydrolase